MARSDEEGFESPSVYRRRQKVVAVSRRRVGSRMRWAAKAAAFIVGAACLAAVAAWYVRGSSRFDLSGPDSVILIDNHFVSQADIASAIGAGAEPNLFRLSLDDARHEVEAIPWVQSASLRRVFPNYLQVEVTERKPVAYVNTGDGLKLVDREGVLLEKPPEAAFDFPVVTGIDSSMSAADRKARLALFDRFEQELKSQVGGAGWLVSEVDLSDDGDLKALLVQGRETILVHFGNRDFGERFRTFLTLLPQIQSATANVDSVDLRYRGQAVVSPKPPAGEDAANAARPAPVAAVRGESSAGHAASPAKRARAVK
ncbi:MAG TPA: FtsQ-type POTRA domain-containing protein [Terriglobia bacterium]|nr:FtsQ-type POTRA domain-containing protein [Terriglobia bacterium]